MRTVARERTIICLDPGTTKTCALVVRIAGRIPHVIGAARATSVGIRRGAITDLRSAAASIAQATQEACRAAGTRGDRAWTAVSGEHIEGLAARAEAAPAGPEVRQRDLDQCLRRAAEGAHLPPGREVLHTLPGEFAVDGQPGIASPLGMAAQRLSVDAFLVTASSSALDNLERGVESAGLCADQQVLSSLAAAWATTDVAERAAGVLVVDIGGGTTDFIAFRDGRAALVGCLGVAGTHVTRDIAVGLRVTMGEAERLKREHAAALARLVPACEIRLACGDRAGRWFLAEIVEARMREILELVRSRVRQAALAPTLAVLTGGETRLAGSAPLAEEVLGCPVRVGAAAAPGDARVARDPAWAVALGLARYAAEQRPASAPRGGPIARAQRWVRESFK
jgi:cell division protein FtsA